MPIGADRFEELNDVADDEPTPGTNAAAILAFLRANPDRAFTQREIAAATDVTRGSVGPTLVRLRERGRVDHRGTYWRVSDHEESVAAATDATTATVAAREDDGETPRLASWRSHAVDPRDHRDESGDDDG